MSIGSFLAALTGTRQAVNGARPKTIQARHLPKAAIGRGFADPTHREGMKRLTLTLDEATFARVRDYAVAGSMSFAAAARELIERGFNAGPSA